MNKEKIEKIIKEDDKMLDQNKKEEVKEENTKNVEEKKTKKKTNENEEKTEEKEIKKHKVGVRTPIYKKMNLSIIGISNKTANEAVMKLNNTDKKILQGAIIDSSYCKIYRKVLVSLYDEKYKDAIASLFSNKNIKCLLEDNESSLALASKLKEEIKTITAVNEVDDKEKEIEEEVKNKEKEIEEEVKNKEKEIEEEVKNKEKEDNKVKEELVKETVEEKNSDNNQDHSDYDNSWKNYEPKGGSRFFSSLGLKIAFIKNAIITH